VSPNGKHPISSARNVYHRFWTLEVKRTLLGTLRA